MVEGVGGEEVADAGEAVLVAQKAMGEAHGKGRGKIRTRPVEGIIIGNGATTRRWQELEAHLLDPMKIGGMENGLATITLECVIIKASMTYSIRI